MSVRGVLEGPPILFVDLDGTVRHGFDELGRFVNEPDDVVIFPEALARMAEWTDRGGIVVGVTNQAGVSLGYMTPQVCEATLARTVDLTDGAMATALCCPHAPDAGCFCRKPMPGMIFRAALWVEQAHGEVARERCLMVGDRAEDRLAADAAGVRFLDAAAWRAGHDPE